MSQPRNGHALTARQTISDSVGQPRASAASSYNNKNEMATAQGILLNLLARDSGAERGEAGGVQRGVHRLIEIEIAGVVAERGIENRRRGDEVGLLSCECFEHKNLLCVVYFSGRRSRIWARSSAMLSRCISSSSSRA